MKKKLLVFLSSLYAIFILGLFLHTSTNPQLFGKYTIKYFLFLLVVLFFIIPLLGSIFYIGKKQKKIKIGKKIFMLTPLRKSLMILCIFIVLIILPIEVFLRNKYQNFESTTYQYSIDNFHPFLQFQLGNTYTSNINSFGFRGEEMTKEKSAGIYRIFILGGSTVLNKTTAFEMTGPRILEKLLREKYPNKKIEVMNAGVDGFTSEHSLIQYLFYIKDFNPDMVVMWHGFNDWYYSCSPQERAYGSFKSDYSHFFGADALMVKEHFSPQPIIGIKLVTFDFFIKFLQDNWYSDIRNLYLANNSSSGFYTQKTENNQYEMKDFASLPSYTRNLQSLINSVLDDNVILILGNQPYLYSENLDQKTLSKIYFPVLHCSKDGKYPTISSVINGMTKYNKATKDVAAKNNIPFIDLESQIPKNLEYFTDDVHYTEKGNEQIGNALSQFIISNSFLEN